MQERGLMMHLPPFFDRLETSLRFTSLRASGAQVLKNKRSKAEQPDQ
jgi:hypothetical protein